MKTQLHYLKADLKNVEQSLKFYESKKATDNPMYRHLTNKRYRIIDTINNIN